MADTSVKAPQLRPDADVLSQDARERPALDRALEACEVAARVRATARLVPPGHEDAFAGREAEQFALPRAPGPGRGPPPPGRGGGDRTPSGTGGNQTLNVTGTGRYLRMYGTARATQYGYRLWELGVHTS